MQNILTKISKNDVLLYVEQKIRKYNQVDFPRQYKMHISLGNWFFFALPSNIQNCMIKSIV